MRISSAPLNSRVMKRVKVRQSNFVYQVDLRIKEYTGKIWAITALHPDFNIDMKTNSPLLKFLEGHCFIVPWAPEIRMELEQPVDLDQTTLKFKYSF